MIRQSKNERGMALIVVLFALMLLTAIGLGLMYMTTTETGIDSNFRGEQTAYYASKAGLEEARDRLRYNPCAGCAGAYSANAQYDINTFLNYTNGWALPTTAPAANTGSVVYIVNSSGATDPVTPWTPNTAYFDDELCHENFTGLGLTATAATVPCDRTKAPAGNTWYTALNSFDPNTGTNAATPYKWVRITLKQNSGAYCSDGPPGCPLANQPICSTMNTTSAIPPYYETPLPKAYPVCEADNMRSVYVLTSLSILPDGSRKMTQYEVANMVIPPLPGSITFDGSGPNFNPPNSNALTISGVDAHTCSTWQAPTMPAVAAYDATSTTTITSDIPSNRKGNYQGAGGTPSVVNSYNQLGVLNTVGGLQQLVSNIQYAADQTYNTNNPTISNMGTDASPLITVVNGDFTWSGKQSGSGILLVTGTMTITGTPSYDGVVLIVGKGSLVYKGSGSGVINGGLFIANLYDSAGKPLPSTGGPGNPNLAWSGGGNLSLNYDSCWTNRMSDRAVLRVLASHEEVY
ncbi:MAG TPA: pilus assembly PilX N-terminal domain-containing protein [Terriglobales bacterium]|nr:pilus assembly PilX N-terminal domain-containing protein [Terriglobales bacterium]